MTKKALLIIAEDNFRDEEFLLPKEALEKNGIEVKVASTKLGVISGMFGAQAQPDILLKDAKAGDFDAVVFIGGVGASQYWDDRLAHKLAQEALNSGRLVGAICIAPVTLAKAGLLKGKKATVWQSEAGQLKLSGADFTGKPVEKDGNIITAAGPFAAAEFGEELAKALK